MKYFIHSSYYHFSERMSRTTELSKDDALEWYKLKAGAGFANLKAVPNFLKGNEIVYNAKTIWGENISDMECFRRRLEGTLK